ncbi:hypothetical protein CLOM_g13887 [Closterium sp. NIES-68]|nr:hypothetical protein CLOM_g13887 [Closterium sp. NIES-68]GJP71004.1 hypothetical protein CLOP_g1889 [Closterium sp. NIES-67]
MARSSIALLVCILAVAAMTSFPGALARKDLGVVKPAATTPAPAKCIKSTIRGYNQSVTLTSGLLLHWNVTGASSIDMAIEAQSTSAASKGGWLSIAFAKSTFKMANSDAIIGNLAGTAANPATVAPYAITSYTAVKPTSAFALTSASTTTTIGKSVVVAFSRSGATGMNPIVYGFGKATPALNYITYAYSANGVSKTVAYHGSGRRGKAVVNLACKPL